MSSGTERSGLARKLNFMGFQKNIIEQAFGELEVNGYELTNN